MHTEKTKNEMEPNARHQMQPFEQLSIFSTADDSIAKAIEAIRALDFNQAGLEIETAAQIDPFLTNLETWRKIIGLFLKGSPVRRLADFLAETWRSVSGQIETGQWHPKEAGLADREIAEIANRHLEQSDGFLDTDRSVHWGFLLAARGEYKQAQKTLTDSLTNGHGSRADLWACYADVLKALGRHPESQAALVRALVLDANAVDLYRIQIPEIHTLYAKLRLYYPPKEARELLLFSGWLESLWTISRPGRHVDLISNEIQQRISKTTGQDRADRYRRFGLYFYLDRLCDSGDMNLEAREGMMALEPDLFRRYLKKVDETQSELFTSGRG